jgi:alkanesulfonate monooxygenase SsuD/methylene tetrahydromethanopterin reductase-like flavin-dependent oxidoreductase (luciferase family)
MAKVEIGIRAPHSIFGSGPDAIAAFATGVERAGVDRIWVGDHVSFRGGQGYDGMLQAAVLASLTRTVTVQTAVYLLPLRHPVPVARQAASICEIAPGRFVMGVGVGGDDPQEMVNCGVDPARRGRRTDESLSVLRRLLAGEVVDHSGPEFSISGASIDPVPFPPVPVVVGGRSEAARRRAGRFSEGWLALFTDPSRFGEGILRVQEEAVRSGRTEVPWDHGILFWCGLAANREKARSLVAPAVEGLYRMPFERFERYVPYGGPEEVADVARLYVEAGAGHLLLSPLAADPEEALAGAAAVSRLLRAA